MNSFSTLTIADFLVISIACYRAAHLLVKEDAPFRLMARLRQRTTLGGMLECIWCASFWCALIMLLLWHTSLQSLVWLFAVSGAALMLSAYTGANHL